MVLHHFSTKGTKNSDNADKPKDILQFWSENDKKMSSLSANKPIISGAVPGITGLSGNDHLVYLQKDRPHFHNCYLCSSRFPFKI